MVFHFVLYGSVWAFGLVGSRGVCVSNPLGIFKLQDWL